MVRVSATTKAFFHMLIHEGKLTFMNTYGQSRRSLSFLPPYLLMSRKNKEKSKLHILYLSHFILMCFRVSFQIVYITIYLVCFYNSSLFRHTEATNPLMRPSLLQRHERNSIALYIFSTYLHCININVCIYIHIFIYFVRSVAFQRGLCDINKYRITVLKKNLICISMEYIYSTIYFIENKIYLIQFIYTSILFYFFAL